MSRLKSAAFFIAIAAVPVAIVVFMNAPSQAVRAPVGALVAQAIGGLVLGFFGLALAATLYMAMLLTAGFTFNFGRPVFARFKPRLFVLNILLQVLVVLGAALFLSAFLGIPFRMLGVRLDPLIVALVLTMVVSTIAFVRFNVWAPIGPKLARKRLGARGVTEGDLARGEWVGVSDPKKSGWKKILIEDDVGMLWLEPDRLVYRGDADSFEIRRPDLVEIERETLAASTSAYAGNRHIVLRMRTPTGDRRVRLHAEGEWSLGRVVRATNRLADRLSHWRDEGTSPAPLTIPGESA